MPIQRRRATRCHDKSCHRGIGRVSGSGELSDFDRVGYSGSPNGDARIGCADLNSKGTHFARVTGEAGLEEAAAEA